MLSEIRIYHLKSNGKYKFSKFLTSLFFTQEFIPSRTRRKYFERIRTFLSQQHEVIEAQKRKSFQRKAIEKQRRFFVLVMELVWEFMIHVGRLNVISQALTKIASDVRIHQEVFRWVGPCNSTWVCSEIRGIPHIPNILHGSTLNFVDLC
ncbi:unnamed protein product [Rhizophagus irregularis]|nr:unnamed protein product [Rhizophagus irregularis]CAB5372391.1 unnamed protein product [Rhizophagus irregularis]